MTAPNPRTKPRPGRRKAAGHVQMAKYRPGIVSAFADGSLGVQPHAGRITVALLVDALVVGAVDFALSSMLVSTPGIGGAGLLIGIGSLILLTPWAVGMLCFNGHTPGTLVGGTRLVRLEDGSAPGLWRGGWLMFQRTVLIVFAPALLLIDLFGDGGSFSSSADDFIGFDRSFHVSIDKRRTAALRNGSWRP